MSDGVAHYYDRNTRRFLLVSHGSSTHSIHRELWGPGVTNAHDAARYVDRLVADEIEASSSGRVRGIADFGCGVGGTLLYLSERFTDARLLGVTISAKQVEIAARLVEQAGAARSCSILRGDFHSIDLGESVDAIVAIESLAHSDNAEAFFANAARHLASGGALLVADDFLVAEPDSLDTDQRRRVDQLRAGWRLPGLRTVESLVASAESHGLTLRRDLDLSGYTRPGTRARDRLIALCSPLLDRCGLAPVPFFGNLIGGNALQIGLREGYIRYRMLVFEAVGAPDAGASSSA